MSLRSTAVPRLAVLLLTLAAVPAARAATVDVAVGGPNGLAYNPKVVTINVGDTVRWTNAGGFHNLAADDGSFRCSNDCSSNNSPSSNAWVIEPHLQRGRNVPLSLRDPRRERGGRDERPGGRPGGGGAARRLPFQPRELHGRGVRGHRHHHGQPHGRRRRRGHGGLCRHRRDADRRERLHPHLGNLELGRPGQRRQDVPGSHPERRRRRL